ncbi:MAG: hypothetical protein AB7M12_02805 [Hyphomonadaceae bacterium]
MTFRVWALAAALAVCQVAAAAPAHAWPSGAEIVRLWDKNRDGFVSKAEWLKAGRPLEHLRFVDGNRDGKADAAEIDAAIERLLAIRAGTGGAMRGAK